MEKELETTKTTRTNESSTYALTTGSNVLYETAPAKCLDLVHTEQQQQAAASSMSITTQMAKLADFQDLLLGGSPIDHSEGDYYEMTVMVYTLGTQHEVNMQSNNTVLQLKQQLMDIKGCPWFQMTIFGQGVELHNASKLSGFTEVQLVICDRYYVAILYQPAHNGDLDVFMVNGACSLGALSSLAKEIFDSSAGSGDETYGFSKVCQWRDNWKNNIEYPAEMMISEVFAKVSELTKHGAISMNLDLDDDEGSSFFNTTGSSIKHLLEFDGSKCFLIFDGEKHATTFDGDELFDNDYGDDDDSSEQGEITLADEASRTIEPVN